MKVCFFLGESYISCLFVSVQAKADDHPLGLLQAAAGSGAAGRQRDCVQEEAGDFQTVVVADVEGHGQHRTSHDCKLFIGFC